MKHKILIDGRFIGVGESISRYTLEILRGILEFDKENQYTLLVRPQGKKITKEWLRSHETWSMKPETNNSIRCMLHASCFMLHVLDIPHYSINEQTSLLKYLNAEYFDLVHFTQFNHPIRYRRPYVITIHDLTMQGHLHRQSLAKRAAYNLVMSSAVKNSAKILTISETSKDEIIDYYKVDPKKIVVAHLGINHERFNTWNQEPGTRIQKFKEKHNIVGDYLLYTGMWKKHKNLKRLLEAFEIYLKTQNAKVKTEEGDFLQLVLVGKVDEREGEIIKEINRINRSLTTSYQLPTPIITTGYIDESDLPIAYAGARAYVMPSLSEGFGLPPVEAMACGTPVISSNLSSMPEILGEAALYFDPYNVDEIAMAIERISTDISLRQSLIEKGLAQAARYNWADTAKRTLEVYEEVLIV